MLKYLTPLSALLLLVVACGGDDDAGPFGSGDDPRTEDGLRAAAQRASELIIEDELQDAYRVFTEACREQMSYGDFAALIAVADGLYGAFYDANFEDLTVKDVEVVAFDGDEGRVRVSLAHEDDPDLVIEENADSEGELWIFEDGHWRSADCDTEGLEFGETEEPDDEPTVAEDPSPPDTPESTAGSSGPQLGERVEVEGVTAYTVNEVIDDYEDPDPIFPPEPGERHFAFDVTQEAIADELTFNRLNFHPQDAEGFVYDCLLAEAPNPVFTNRDAWRRPARTRLGGLCRGRGRGDRRDLRRAFLPRAPGPDSRSHGRLSKGG